MRKFNLLSSAVALATACTLAAGGTVWAQATSGGTNGMNGSNATSGVAGASGPVRNGSGAANGSTTAGTGSAGAADAARNNNRDWDVTNRAGGPAMQQGASQAGGTAGDMTDAQRTAASDNGDRGPAGAADMHTSDMKGGSGRGAMPARVDRH